MKTNTNFFTGIAQKIAALSIAIFITNGLTACGNKTEKSESKPQNLEQLQKKADAGLRDAAVIEAELNREQVYLGASGYMRADAVSYVKIKIANSSDSDVVRLRQKISLYKSQMMTAISALKQGAIPYNGPATDLFDRRDTAMAFLREIKAEASSRGL
jgi:hypothetical protein